MSLKRQDSTSLEYLRASTLSDVDPTGHAVYFSLTDEDADDPGTWVAGSWSGDAVATALGSRFAASAIILVGPAGDLEPDVGRYAVWTRVDAAPESPVKRAGVLVIT